MTKADSLHLRSSATLDNVQELEVAVEEADQQWGICRVRIGDG